MDSILRETMDKFVPCEKCKFWEEWVHERFGTCSVPGKTVYNKDLKALADRYSITSRHDSCAAGVKIVKD